jgi:hypothetical protein
MGMKDNQRLQIEQQGGSLRITIPFGTREKIWMAIAVTCMLCFGMMMALVGELAARSVTHSWPLLAIPFVILGVIVGFYLLSLLIINSMPGSVIEYDGKTLSIGSSGSERRTSWPREKIKALRVSRLPMVPVANIVIQPANDPSVRAGIYGRRDLEAAMAKLREAMGLATKDRK